ncbi:MAG: hypothetical protein CL536_03685, partial [Alcaligenaceae bacterium]|nr:hypothetical protein [Alcaligenaceae bacterium]
AIATGPSSASQNAVGLGVLGGMLAATPLAMVFVPTFFVVIMTLFKTRPKKLGKTGGASHSESEAATSQGQS